MYPVYVCENFEVKNNILTIWDAKEVAKVSNGSDFNKVTQMIDYNTQMIDYNSIICPDLYLQDRNVDIILFK
jgi:hypothetical protein